MLKTTQHTKRLLAAIGTAAVTLAVALPAQAETMTVSCKNTKVPAERMVCDTPALAQIDRAHLAIYRNVANKYRDKATVFGQVKQAEIAIRVKRNDCGPNAACIRSAYASGDAQIRAYDKK